MLTKNTILNIKNVYTANALMNGSRLCVGAGSETEPVVQLYDLATETVEDVTNCPGGMMSFVPVPGTPDTFVTIMGLFPPFIGKDAGLWMHKKTDRGWKTSKMVDFPFAHRCEFLPGNGQPILIAAKVSKNKENPQDWAHPGEVYAMAVDKDLDVEWNAELIDASIFRNHGMCKAIIDGEELLCVSGAEGIFSVTLSDSGSWKLTCLFENEVSEMAFLDLDGDGAVELVTIEPFHGNTFNIYKKAGDVWVRKFTDSLSFGHGLSAGMYNGRPIIVAGNRSDSLALEVFTIDNLDEGTVVRTVIEADAGPTQTQVFRFDGTDYILSANQRKNEVALYTGSLPA